MFCIVDVWLVFVSNNVWLLHSNRSVAYTEKISALLLLKTIQQRKSENLGMSSFYSNHSKPVYNILGQSWGSGSLLYNLLKVKLVQVFLSESKLLSLILERSDVSRLFQRVIDLLLIVFNLLNLTDCINLFFAFQKRKTIK